MDEKAPLAGLPPYQTDQPPYQADQPSYQAVQPPNQADQPPYQAGQPPYQANQPPYQAVQQPQVVDQPQTYPGQLDPQQTKPPTGMVQPQPMPAPPDGSWHQGPPQQQQVVITQQVQPSVVAVQTQCFLDVPITLLCPHCNNMVSTETHRESGSAVWLAAVILCFVGFLFFFICCIGLIPFCIPSMMDTVHTCPSCHTVLGKHRRM